MKLTRITITLLVIAMAMTGAAFANCIPAKTFTNFNTIETPGVYLYIEFSDTTLTSSDLLGRFWTTGNRAASNEGGYDDAAWLLPSLYYPGSWYLNGNLGDAGVAGCPTGSLTLSVEDQKNGEFVQMTVAEDPPRSVTFDYSKYGVNTAAASIPRPRVTLSNRSGTDVIIDVAVDASTGGVFDEANPGGGAGVEGVTIYQAVNPTSNDIAAGGWTAIGSAADGGTAAGLAVDCSDVASDTSVAASVDQPSAPGATVGQATLIECDPNLADPGKFKLIERPGKPGNGKPLKRR